MGNQIAITDVAEGFRFALTETFESVRGMYLDKGTSLFETLAGISAEQASMPISDNCATIAAQVDHTRFYLDVMHESLVKREYVQGSDWAHIWNTVSTVDEIQRQAIVNNLRASYDQEVADLNHKIVVLCNKVRKDVSDALLRVDKVRVERRALVIMHGLTKDERMPSAIANMDGDNASMASEHAIGARLDELAATDIKCLMQSVLASKLHMGGDDGRPDKRARTAFHAHRWPV